MKVFEAICWAGVVIMAMAAGLRMLSLWLTQGMSAPQYAAEAAGIMVVAIVPYVMARAIQAIRRLKAEA